MITVWGRATSSNVQAVMWAIAEIGLEHERIDVGGAFGGNRTPEYLAMNPNGLVPVIRDGETVLWESAAIVRYLGARYGDETFWPRDPAIRARLDMWAEWIKTSFGPAFNGQLFWTLIRNLPHELDGDQVRAMEARVKDYALILDARLGAGPWLGGDMFTFADIIVGSLLYRYFTLDFDRAATPALAAYYDRCRARPAYARHVMVSYDPLRKQPPRN